MPDSRYAWKSNLYFIVFAAKGTLSEDTIRLFLRQLGKFIFFYGYFLSIYLYVISIMWVKVSSMTFYLCTFYIKYLHKSTKAKNDSRSQIEKKNQFKGPKIDVKIR